MDKNEKFSLDNELEFLENLNIEELKYKISREVGPSFSDPGEICEIAEGDQEKTPPEIDVKITHDKLKAYIKVLNAGWPNAITDYDIRTSLKDNGVVRGILEKSIEEILEGQLIGEDVLIAQGVPAKNGEDGYIDNRIDSRKKKPEDCVDVRGRVDFKAMKKFNSVEGGELIAEIVPATKGEEGFTVTGEILKPTPGEEAQFILTPDVGISPKNEKQLIALKSGILRTDFTITKQYFINGDVDYSTGNPKYSKSLIIKGDVKSGFKVYSGEDIEVRGCVEDATVVAKGDVTVKQGFLGAHKGHIKGKNVIIGHVKQQNVFATGDIIIGGEAIHCNLKAAGFIKMLGAKGVVLGGTLTAEKGIEIVQAGNSSNLRTTLRVGFNKTLIKFESRIKFLRKKREKVDSAIRIFKAARNVENLSDGMNLYMKRILDTQCRLNEELELLEKRKMEAFEKILLDEKSFIRVSQTVFPNTVIHIGHQKKLITSKMNNKTFRYHNNDILIGA